MKSLDHLERFLQEVRRAMPLLEEWRSALIQRDLNALEHLHARLEPVLPRLEQARAQLDEQRPIEPPQLQQALQLAQQLDIILQSAYDIIMNELGYTHELMAMLLRAHEPEHYAPTAERPTPNLMVNTEV